MWLKVYLLLIAFAFHIFLNESIGTSTKPCYTDEHLKKELEKDPNLRKKLDEVEGHWQNNVNFGGHNDDDGSDITRRRRLAACNKKSDSASGINIVKGNSVRYTFKTPELDSDPVPDTIKIFIFGGSGDADLHVKFGAQATLTSYDCRPYENGNNEECVFSASAQPPQRGVYHIMLNAYTAVSGLTILVEWYYCDPLPNPLIIPINIHLIKGPNTPYIAYERIVSQISVLNSDFSAKNDDIEANPGLYNSKIGNFKMGFILNKIIRKTTNKVIFDDDQNNMKFTSTGGSDSISGEYCLNVWVVEIDDGVLGFATFPGGSRNIDGIVIHPTSFGNAADDYKSQWRNGMINGYNFGRTGTHEIGHWLNLRHIWGDGGCSVDDGVSDTSTDDGPNRGCPTNDPHSCNSRDMFMNFMDYTEGDCRTMFTENQVDRGDDLFDDGGFREKMLDYISSPAVSQFVAYFYFVVLNSASPSCDPYHELRNVDIGPPGGKYIYMCIYHSRNPFIDVMSDITISSSCAAGYVKIDTNLNEGNANYGAKYVCYKKVAQSNPLSSNTIINFQITRSTAGPVINYQKFSGSAAKTSPHQIKIREISGELLPHAYDTKNINTDMYNNYYIIGGLLIIVLLILNIACFVKFLFCAQNHKYQLVDKYSTETETENI